MWGLVTLFIEPPLYLLLHSHFEAAEKKIVQERYNEFDAVEKWSVSNF
jgi:hypothetical protein